MNNELVFLFQTIIGLFFTLATFKMGKSWLLAYIGVCIVLANIFVTKQINLFGLAATGGNVVYGSVFLATDLLSGRPAGLRFRHGGTTSTCRPSPVVVVQLP